MTKDEYLAKIKTTGFEEFPYFVCGNEKRLREIVDFEQADLQLKIHLAEVVICRCFSATGGIYFPADAEWFIKEFLSFYKTDIPKPGLTCTIKEAIEMILSNAPFTKGVIGTTFMFGVIEFYAKHLLGYRPMQYDFFDKENHNKFRKMFIGDAINKLKRTNMEIAKSLCRIDKHSIERLKEVRIEEERGTIAKIADRLSLARNTMLHGENHSFYDKGEYLVMLYVLFYLHDVQLEENKESDRISIKTSTPIAT